MIIKNGWDVCFRNLQVRKDLWASFSWFSFSDADWLGRQTPITTTTTTTTTTNNNNNNNNNKQTKQNKTKTKEKEKEKERKIPTVDLLSPLNFLSTNKTPRAIPKEPSTSPIHSCHRGSFPRDPVICSRYCKYTSRNRRDNDPAKRETTFHII